MTRALRALPMALALACAPPIWIEVREPEHPPVVRTVALLPLHGDPAPGGALEPDAAAIVTARVLEALSEETQLEIVPPDKTVLVPGAAGRSPGDAMRSTFGADAVLSGVVRRYVERSGGPGGSARPSAVWFSLELRASDGTLLWTGTYNETQAALSEDLGSIGRAWRRGFRWVTAADLADYGARQLARALAEDTGPWS